VKFKNTTIFYLTGGIGNQLFTFTAGKAFSQINNRNVIFDLADTGRGYTNHGSSILSLNLDLVISPSKPWVYQFLSRVRNKLGRTFKRFARKKQLSEARYISYEIGYDPKLLQMGKARNVRGYFQSWRYFEIAGNSFHSSNELLRRPSRWYLETCALVLKSEPIFLHVRRGDYKQLSDSYGLLDTKYYVDALAIARKFLPDNPIWVVSDDIPEAEKLLASILPANTIWVNPPNGTDAVESLVLMSQGAGNIIANSTFSWWGAALNEKSLVTVAPKKWFKGMQDPQDLYPPDWILVESSWQA
jgi:hypothetical protein